MRAFLQVPGIKAKHGARWVTTDVGGERRMLFEKSGLHHTLKEIEVWVWVAVFLSTPLAHDYSASPTTPWEVSTLESGRIKLESWPIPVPLEHIQHGVCGYLQPICKAPPSESALTQCRANLGVAAPSPANTLAMLLRKRHRCKNTQRRNRMQDAKKMATTARAMKKFATELAATKKKLAVVEAKLAVAQQALANAN